jgi:molecular chaperone GrpE
MADPARLAEEIAARERELGELNDRYLRALADVENLKRRHRQELEDARRFGNEQLLSSLLGVLDNLQRALEAAENSENFAALRDGVSLTQRQLLDLLSRSGLQAIEAVGQPFDPALHEAIGHVEAENGQAPDTVVQEVQRGYTLHGRLLRPSLVRVAG